MQAAEYLYRLLGMNLPEVETLRQYEAALAAAGSPAEALALGLTYGIVWKAPKLETPLVSAALGYITARRYPQVYGTLMASLITAHLIYKYTPYAVRDLVIPQLTGEQGDAAWLGVVWTDGDDSLLARPDGAGAWQIDGERLHASDARTDVVVTTAALPDGTSGIFFVPPGAGVYVTEGRVAFAAARAYPLYDGGAAAAIVREAEGHLKTARRVRETALAQPDGIDDEAANARFAATWYLVWLWLWTWWELADVFSTTWERWHALATGGETPDEAAAWFAQARRAAESH